MKTVRARVSSSPTSSISQAKIERDQRSGLPPPPRTRAAPRRTASCQTRRPVQQATSQSRSSAARRPRRRGDPRVKRGRHAVQDSGRPRRRRARTLQSIATRSSRAGPTHPGRRVRQGPEDARRRREATRRGTRATTKRETKPTEQNLFFMSLYLSRGKERRERATESGRGVDEARARRTVEDRALISLTEGRTDGYIITSRVSVRVPRSSRDLRRPPRARSRVLRSSDARTYSELERLERGLVEELLRVDGASVFPRPRA